MLIDVKNSKNWAFLVARQKIKATFLMKKTT